MKQKTSITKKTRPQAGRQPHAGRTAAKPDAAAYKTLPPKMPATAQAVQAARGTQTGQIL